MSGFTRRDVLRAGLSAAVIGAGTGLLLPARTLGTPALRAPATGARALGASAAPTVLGLTYGTTLVGQSYDAYKRSSGGAAYDAIETDLVSTVGSTVRRGGAVTRVYGSRIGTWAQGPLSALRPDQPVIYSFKADNSYTQAQFSADVRAWLDSKPTTSAHCWLIFFHEPDDDIRAGGKGIPGATNADRLAWWQTRNRWVRDVLNETAYSSRTDVTFGPVYTTVPYQKHQTQNSWQNYYAGMEGVWDFMGIDHYNPAWDGPTRYVPVSNWTSPMLNMSATTGLNWIVAETGTPRATRTNGLTVAQQDAERVQWATGIVDAATQSGTCEAMCWWRRPAFSGFQSPYSTIEFTPTGFNSAADAAAGYGPPGGTDAQHLVDLWSTKAHASIAAANRPIPYFT